MTRFCEPADRNDYRSDSLRANPAPTNVSIFQTAGFAHELERKYCVRVENA